jgi:aspartate/methionine/tyrosine aminotransferase
MFLWGSIPEKYANSVELSDRLLYQANVFVTPGIIFGKNGQNHIRISLCSSQDLLLNAKKRIIKHLNNPA